VFVVDHRLQRRPGALFSRGDRRISFTERGQHFHRQTFEQPFAVKAFLRRAAWASNAERRAACLTDC
jgi:hypothetical protein